MFFLFEFGIKKKKKNLFLIGLYNFVCFFKYIFFEWSLTKDPASLPRVGKSGFYKFCRILCFSRFSVKSVLFSAKFLQNSTEFTKFYQSLPNFAKFTKVNPVFSNVLQKMYNIFSFFLLQNFVI